MTFTLTTPKGRIYKFYVEEAAKLFQRAYGGKLVTNL